MDILITGGNGFLGRNTIEYLLQHNHRIMVLSRTTDNIQNILNRIEFIKINSDYSNYADEILRFSPNVIIHFAWDGGNNYEDSNGINQVYKNIPNSLSLLEIIGRLNNGPRFVGVGCFGEYGYIKKQAKEEQIELPSTFYGLSKNIFKNISKMYCEQNSIEWTWIRPCFIYGYGDVHTRLFPKLINNLLNNKKINLDMCNQKIDYLNISDFCSAIGTIITEQQNGIFNVCSGEEYHLKTIIEFIEKEIQNYDCVIHNSDFNRKFANNYICGSNKKLKTITTWKPIVNINDGLIDMINKYKKEIMKND